MDVGYQNRVKRVCGVISEGLNRGLRGVNKVLIDTFFYKMFFFVLVADFTFFRLLFQRVFLPVFSQPQFRYQYIRYIIFMPIHILFLIEMKCKDLQFAVYRQFVLAYLGSSFPFPNHAPEQEFCNFEYSNLLRKRKALNIPFLRAISLSRNRLKCGKH